MISISQFQLVVICRFRDGENTARRHQRKFITTFKKSFSLSSKYLLPVTVTSLKTQNQFSAVPLLPTNQWLIRPSLPRSNPKHWVQAEFLQPLVWPGQELNAQPLTLQLSLFGCNCTPTNEQTTEDAAPTNLCIENILNFYISRNRLIIPEVYICLYRPCLQTFFWRGQMNDTLLIPHHNQPADSPL